MTRHRHPDGRPLRPAAGRPPRRPEVAADRLVHRAGGGALHRLHPRPGRPGRSLQLLRLVRARAADRLRRSGQLPRGVRGPALPAGDGAQRDPGRALARASSSRWRSASRCSSTGRCADRSVLRLIFFAPYVLSEAITAIVFLQILQPGGLVDATPGRRRPRRARPALARRPLARLLHALRRHHLEVHRLRDHPLPRRAPGHPARAARGGGDRRRDELDDAALHHAAAARADDPHLGVPGDHRVDPALRPRLDHDPRRAGGLVLDDGDLHGRQGVNSLRIGYATSVAVILFFICFVVSILYQIFVLRRDVAGGVSRMAG